jgi:hypothetical protein
VELARCNWVGHTDMSPFRHLQDSLFQLSCPGSQQKDGWIIRIFVLYLYHNEI